MESALVGTDSGSDQAMSAFHRFDLGIVKNVGVPISRNREFGQSIDRRVSVGGRGFLVGIVSIGVGATDPSTNADARCDFGSLRCNRFRMEKQHITGISSGL